MQPDSPLWKQITESQFPCEREALAFVREHLPDGDPIRAWANFEFVDDGGQVHEVDLLVLTRRGFFLVEIKSWSGVIEGNTLVWTWTRSNGTKQSLDNPLLLANRKAKKLIALLRGQKALRNERTVPYLEPLVFLSDPVLQRRLPEALDAAVVGRDRFESIGPDPEARRRIVKKGIIDAPGTVASFLQRVGRTGRRPGTRRNCLFLTTSDEAFLRAAGLIRLWSEGYVEPVVPPRRPLHVLAQQLLALILQEGGIAPDAWRGWFAGVAGLRDLDVADVDAVVQHMLATQILHEADGLLSFGPEGERLFGRRNFLELLSVFTSPPLFKVLHGRSELGQVHATTFLLPTKGERALVLGGRSWKVTYVDWGRRVAQVEPTEARGRSRWVGQSPPLSFQLCQAVRRVLAGADLRAELSRRAQEELERARADHPWVDVATTVLRQEDDGALRWWTFGGKLANAALGAVLGVGIDRPPHVDDYYVEIAAGGLKLPELAARLQELPNLTDEQIVVPIQDEAVQELKFAQCLPADVAQRMLTAWSTDIEAVRSLFAIGAALPG